MALKEYLSSEDLRGHKGLEKFESVDALANSYLNMESMQGNSLRIPSADASLEVKAESYKKVIARMPELMLRPNPDSPEQMQEYYTMLGVPDSMEGYSSEGINLPTELLEELKTLAHSNHFTKTQWQGYVGKMAEMQGTTNQNAEDARMRMGAELKTEWGLAFEDRYGVVERHLEENPDAGRIEDMSPAQMKYFYNTSRSLIGTSQVNNQPMQHTGRFAPEELKARIKEIEDDQRFRSNDPQDRIYSLELMKKKLKLQQDLNAS